MKILYYDCFSGISGDMNLGALVDVGVPFEYLKKELSKLNLDNEFKIIENKEIKNGIYGTKVKVIDLNNENLYKLNMKRGKHENFGHSHKIEEQHHHHHGKNHSHKHLHEHTHEGSHLHEQDGHMIHEHHHGHSRNYAQIKEIIKSSTLSQEVIKKAIDIFYIVAKAEGKIHNKPLEEVHFHEVGAIDSIVDIVGCAIGIHYLKIDKVISSPIEVGYGTLKCAHGIMPVPAPATTEILKDITIKSENVPFEATTPTGAAIIKGYAENITYKKNFNIKKIGYGIGEKENPNMANALRIILGEIDENFQREVLLECNIDDMRPEEQEILMERIFKERALDVFYNPIFMKKQRLGIKLSVIARDEDKEKIKDVIFRNSTTIGIREIEITRTKLERKEEVVNSKYGKVPVKVSYYKGEILNVKPEYDNCKEIAYKENISINDVYNEVLFNYKMR
ncbi:nickel pincer cofactor biosynthesis protein LarC [uncultured Clostridium sp.]|uniref:nickel pincer cofactor biosynthesis protein LarC n=1 Tax=uncultured Clostridium sp. TaxID=59620 RepID=UPI00262922F8|nr:nickel pincer cofactor biosynthesis protein LarC [uncultured Clostridium sp.]